MMYQKLKINILSDYLKQCVIGNLFSQREYMEYVI